MCVCVCVRARAGTTNDHVVTWGRKDPERWGAIPIHPPVQTCYKFAFALVLHAVHVSFNSSINSSIIFSRVAENDQKPHARAFLLPHHVGPCHFFKMISVDALRRAVGRGTATFFGPEPHWSGVYVAKRAFSTKTRRIAFFLKLIRAFRFEQTHVTSRQVHRFVDGGGFGRDKNKEPFAA